MTELLDKYQRRVEYLRLSITDRCNLRCSYCMPAEGVSDICHDEIMRYEEFIRIVKVLIPLGIKKIRITGGEPTVRKGVVDFTAALHNLTGIEEIAMTTNGIVLKKLALPLKKAGLKRVNISLDTLKPNRYRMITRVGDFAQCWAGIQSALEVGLNPVKLNVVLQNGVNTDEILDFARLTFTHPLHIRFIEFMTRDAETDTNFFSNDETFEILKELGELKSIGGITGVGPAKNFQFSNAKGTIGLISPISHKFCSSCNRIRLTADGKLLLCLGSDKFLDLKKHLRNGISDKELTELIINALHDKPAGHKFGDTGLMRGMSTIGG